MTSGSWLLVDEDERGAAVAAAVRTQVPLTVIRDPFAVRRLVAAERIGGIIVCPGTRTLSLKSMCRHVRATLPATCIVAIAHPRLRDDPELVALCTGVIQDGDGDSDRLLGALSRLSPAFEAPDPTQVLPPPPQQAKVSTLPARTSTPARTSSPPATPTRPPLPPALPLVSAPMPAAPPPAVAIPARGTPAPWAGLVSLLDPPKASPSAAPTTTATTTTPTTAPTTTASTTTASTSAAAITLDDDDEATESTLVSSASPDVISDEATQSVRRDFETSEPEAAREPIEGSGAELLVRLACGRRTGRLLVADGAGAGIVDVKDGEPVASTLPTGDGGLYRVLVAEGVLSAAHAPPLVPQGRLLSALVDRGMVEAQKAQDIVWRMTREHCLRLCSSGAVRGVFVESAIRAPSFDTSARRPPLNVFGLAVEARRVLLASDVLAALYEEIAQWRLASAPLLATAEHLVAPFTKGRPLAPLVNGISAQRLLSILEWDRAMGTLLLLALRESGLMLVSVADDRAPSRRHVSTNSPRALLGLGVAPDERDIVAARDERIAAIDALLNGTTDVDDRHRLLSERHSLEVACEALRLQLGFATAVRTDDDNPF